MSLLDLFPFKKPIDRRLNILKVTRDFRRHGWFFTPERAVMVANEWLLWKKQYLPVSVKGKVVLDVGAGCGETAFFYLKHGARFVMAMEPSDVCFPFLKKNSSYHRIIVCQKKFSVEDLDLPVDFIKMDIEGYEECVLGHEPKIPMIVEIHGLQLRDRFKANGWRIEGDTHDESIDITLGYWNC